MNTQTPVESNLKYPLDKHTPLVIESYRKKEYNGATYKRRLRISKFNAFQIDEVLGTTIAQTRARFVVLALEDIEKACKVLGVEYKPVNTYFDIDLQMCSFRTGPWDLRNKE